MFSFAPLWKLLIDRKMTKTDLRLAIRISTTTLAQMGKNEYISMDVLHRICEYFNVQPGEVLEYVKEEEGGN